MSVQDAKLLLAMGVSFSFVLPFFLDLYKRRQKTFLSRKNSENFLDLIFPPEKRHKINEEFLDFSRDVKTAFSPSAEPGNPFLNIAGNDSPNFKTEFYEKIITKYHKYLCLSNIESLRKSKNQLLLGWTYYALVLFTINSTGLVMLILEPEILTNFIPSEFFPYLIVVLCFLLPTSFFIRYIIVPLRQKKNTLSVWNELKDKLQQETDNNKKEKQIRAKIKEKYHPKMESYIKIQNEKYIKNPT